MQELSPFHQELLTFLKKDSALRVEKEGFNPTLDRSVAQFQQSIQQAFEEGSALQLDEILEGYQQLFHQRGTVHIECHWMSSFSEKEFTELGLLRYYPRIYRGLPRLYKRNNPSQQSIKKNFTDLASLRKLSIEKALYSLYEGSCKPRRVKMALFTWIIPDGLGDWMAMQEAALTLKTRFPWIELELFAISARPLPQGGPFPLHVIPYEKEVRASLVSDEILGQLRDTDLILQLPTYFPETEELFSALLQIPSDRPLPRVEHIGEYGYLESSWFHPKSGCRSMGLHALEKGIFVRRGQIHSFQEIENRDLLQFLFHTETPREEKIAAYQATTHFHFGYLSTPHGGAIFLHSLLKKWEKDDHSIDLCAPDPSWWIRWIQMREKEKKPLLEESFGVKEILFSFGDQTHSIPIDKNGRKTVRIFDPGSLSPTDVRRLLYLSEGWVGIRGNQSLSEAITAGKPFYYDGREHSRYFLKDLLALAQNRLSSFKPTVQAFRLMAQAFLYNLPEEKGDWVDESYFQQGEALGWFEIAEQLGQCLQEAETIRGFQYFGKVIREEFSFNRFLCHFVERLLVHQVRPSLATFEQAQMQLYAQGTSSFSTLVKNLRVGMMSSEYSEVGNEGRRGERPI